MYNLVGMLSFIFGTIIGSFLNVVILRLPKEERLGGRSHCVHCGHVLEPWELMPLLSFAWLRGKCSSCKRRISSRYFIIESVCGLLFAGAFLLIAPADANSFLMLCKFWLCAAVAVVVFVIDWEYYLIFDAVVLPAAAATVLLNIGMDRLGHHTSAFASLTVQSLLGSVAGALPFFLVWLFSRGKWMGFGDVKLMLFIGAATGLRLVGVSVLLAVFSGGLISAALLVFSKKTLKSQIPFGTFLSASLVVTLAVGERLLHWYLALLGF